MCILTYSIMEYIAATHVKNVLQPVHLDASAAWEQWAALSRNSCDVIIAINLLQYNSFKTAQVGLLICANHITHEEINTDHICAFHKHFL